MNFRSLLALSFALAGLNPVFGSKVLPVLNAPLSNLSRLPGAAGQTFNLTAVFGTEAIDDQVVRFTTQSSIGSLTLDFALFSNRTPGTRSNFLNYVNDGDYNNSIIHRSVPRFVIQGGGWYHDPNSAYLFDTVPTDPPIANEFGISNTHGTVSMAKLGNDPNSATSQWFISLGDNSANLDKQNGGFTVFARITQSTIANAAAIGSFPIWNVTNTPFSELPLDAGFEGDRGIVLDDFVLFTSVELVDIDPTDAGSSTTLSYSVVANSKPGVVDASIANGSDLLLDFAASNAGASLITVRATDSVGNTVEDSFTVTVSYADHSAWLNAVFTPAELADPSISGPNVDANGDGLTNLELYLHGLNRRGFHQHPVIFTNAVIADARYASFTFPILNTISDISYTLEQSSDLGQTDDWSPVAFTEVSRTTAGPVDTVQIRADAPAGTPSDFYRIRFTKD